MYSILFHSLLSDMLKHISVTHYTTIKCHYCIKFIILVTKIKQTNNKNHGKYSIEK